MTKKEPQIPSFVIAAMLAGHLHRMMQIAQLMLLSASNAKGVATRAGENARGFRPITDFIAEMANDTIHFATKINQLALTVSRSSVSALRASDGARRFAEARVQLPNEEQADFIDQLIQESTKVQVHTNREIKEIMSELNDQLDEINQRVRGSSIVVSTSRTEAARAAEFQQYLNSIADSVEEAATDLKHEIGECRNLIGQLISIATTEQKQEP